MIDSDTLRPYLTRSEVFGAQCPHRYCSWHQETTLSQHRAMNLLEDHLNEDHEGELP